MARVGVAMTADAVPAAYEVCRLVWSGTDPDEVVAQVADANQEAFYYQAEAFVVAAISIYCPPDTTAHKKVHA